MPAVSPQSTSRRHIRKWLRLVSALVVAFAALIAVSHALLWWSLDRLSSGDLRLSYQRAFSFVPGTLRLRSVSISRPAEWVLTVDAIDGSLVWSSLLGAEARFRWVRARGVRLKLHNGVRAPLEERSARPEAAGLHVMTATTIAGSAVAQPWTIEQLNASVESIEDRGRQLRLIQGMQLSSENVQGSRNGLVTARTQLSLGNSRLERGKRRLASLSGSIETERARIWLRGGLGITSSLQWAVTARGRSNTLVRASLKGPMHLEHGRPAPPTHLTLQLHEPATWAQDAVRAELDEGSRLDIVAAADGRVTGTARLPQLRLGREESWALTLRSVIIERIWLRNLLRARPGPVGLILQAEHANLETSAWPAPIESTIVARVTLVREGETAWVLGSGRVELPNVTSRDTAPAAHGTRAVLDIDRASVRAGAGLELSGRLEISGPSLSSLLRASTLPQPIQLMLGPFLRQPFEVQAQLTGTEGAVSLRELRMRAGELQVAGYVEQRGGSRNGALLVSTPLTSLGLRLDGDHETAVFRPPVGWLRRQGADPR